MDFRRISVLPVTPIKVSSFYSTQGPSSLDSVWNVRFNDAPTTVGFFSDVPLAPSVKDTPGMGKHLRLAGREDLCVTVAGGSAYVGAPVVM
jgi:hypothetical protein